MHVGVIDVETDGLWGRPFAIGAVIFNDKMNIINKYFVCTGVETISDDFVKREIVPAVLNETMKPKMFATYADMLADFALWYNEVRGECIWLNHLGYIVDAFLFRELKQYDLIGVFDAPFPFVDVGSMLHVCGHDATSVEAYVKLKALEVPTDIVSVHHPIRDCIVTAVVYFDLMKMNYCSNTKKIKSCNE